MFSLSVSGPTGPATDEIFVVFLVDPALIIGVVRLGGSIYTGRVFSVQHAVRSSLRALLTPREH